MGYWRLNDSSTTAADASGNGRNFIYSAFDMSKVHIGSSGRWNQGVRFTGLGSITNPGSGTNPPALQPPITGTYSAEVWMRLGSGQSPSANVQLFYVGEPWRMDSAARVLQGQLQVVSDTDWTGWRTVGPRLDDGYWHHIAYTRSQFSHVAVYIDGVQVTSSTASSWTHGGTVLAFGNYTGASTGIDLTIDGAAFYTSALSAARVATHYNHDGAAPSLSVSGSLWDRRNQSQDHRNEGLYNAEYYLDISATDGTLLDPDSGVERLEVFVGGQSKWVKTQVCLTGGCSLSGRYTMLTDQFTDGDYTISVVATDRAGKSTPWPPFTVTVDRRGDVYAGEQFTGDPSNGGQLLVREWARLNTKIARREAVDRITTRTNVACTDGSSSDCPEVRYRTLESAMEGADGSDLDTFSRHTGATAGDPHIAQIADLLTPKEAVDTGQSATETGPIMNVLGPWQTPPPVRGTQYELYEFSGTQENSSGSPGPTGEYGQETESKTIQLRVWVDAATKLPLRQTISVDGQETPSYWSYSRQRGEASTLPTDFFRVAEPATYDQEASTEYQGDGSSGGDPQDSQTGATFSAYFLGGSVTLTSGFRCLDTTALFNHHEPDNGDVTDGEGGTTRDLSMLTRVDALYAALPTGTACVPGRGDGTGVDLMVSSFAKNSEFAAAYRETIMATAEAIALNPADPDYFTGGTAPYLLGAQPQVAYVVPAPDGTSTALTEIGSTTVVVNGSFSKADVPTLLNRLEVR